jgi:anti-sigma factor RsiW
MSNVHPALDDLLDGRLSGEDRRRAQEHLSGCDVCRPEWERLTATRQLLREAVEDEPMPESVGARVSAALDREVRPRRAPINRRFVAAVTLAAAAAILIAVVLLRKPGPDFPTEAFGDLDSVASATLPLDLRTANTGEMERWFDARLDFPTRVFDFAMMRYHLIGGRIDSLAGRRSALFAYRHESGALVVCQMFEGKTDELPAGSERRVHNGIEFFIYDRNGTTAVFWQEGSIVCVLASAVPRDETVSLAFAKAMKPAST